MNSIYQSPFLIALGWTIAASIWQSALLWLFYQAICSVHRHISPARKHFIASLLLLGSLGWFSITLANKYSEIIKLNEYLSGFAENTNTVTHTYSPEMLFSHKGLTDFANQYLPYISAAYLIVLLLLSVKLINAYLHSKQLKTKGLLPIDEHWINLVNTYARKIGIVKKVNIHLSRYISVPATLNFFKPVILLPLAAFSHLTPQQVESIILHELAHIKRNDYLINIIASVIETILFFNPFVHLLGKSLKKEREHCCDDFVLQHRFDPHSYASALLSLEQLRVGMQSLAIAATGRSNYQLLGRIKRIMNVSTTHFNYGQKLLALVLMAFIMISVAWLSPSPRNNTAASRAEDVYNNEAGSADQRISPAPAVAEHSTTRTKTLPANNGSISGTSSQAKTKQSRAANTPVLPPGIDHPVSPSVPGEVWQIPHPPVPPAPEPIFHENNDVGQAPDPFMAQGAPEELFGNHDFGLNLRNGLLNIYTEHNAMEWENTGEDMLKEDPNNVLSINDFVKLIEDAKIKSSSANSRLLEQLRILINNNMLHKEQLQPEGMLQNKKQLNPETPENKAAGKARKNRIAALNNAILFLNPLAEKIPDIREAFTEEKLKLDSIRKTSVELVEKQKALWLRQIKEKRITVENEAPVVYELIVHIDNNAPLRPSTVKRLQQNAPVILHSNKTERAGRTNSATSRKNAQAFTFAPSQQDNRATITTEADDHRVIHANPRQRMVISL